MDQSSRPSHQSFSENTKMELATKKRKKNQQSVKVVHFSNPVRVTTTAAEFRALVQELTGRDSHIADLLAGHPPAIAGVDLVPGGGADQTGIYDFPATDFKVESGYGDYDSYGVYGERFGRVEDFGGVVAESVLFETPVIAGESFCGWVL